MSCASTAEVPSAALRKTLPENWSGLSPVSARLPGYHLEVLPTSNCDKIRAAWAVGYLANGETLVTQGHREIQRGGYIDAVELAGSAIGALTKALELTGLKLSDVADSRDVQAGC